MRRGPNGAGLSRKAIMSEIDASLRRLGMDYVDLYQIHRWDDRTPIEETMEALHDVVRAGKARYIGASSMWAWQFSKAQHVARGQRLDAVRHDAGPLQPAVPGGGAGDAPLCLDLGVGVIPWSPLARGRLTRDWDATTRAARPTSSARCWTPTPTRRSSPPSPRSPPSAGCSRASRSPWPGCRGTRPSTHRSSAPPSRQHIDDAIASLDIELTDDEVTRLESPYTTRPTAGFA